MIRAVDHDELFRVGRARVELAHVFQRADFIALAVNEEFWFRAVSHGTEGAARTPAPFPVSTRPSRLTPRSSAGSSSKASSVPTGPEISRSMGVSVRRARASARGIG